MALTPERLGAILQEERLRREGLNGRGIAPTFEKQGKEFQMQQSTPAPITCSFCAKTSHEVEVMVAGPNIYICNECVDLSVSIIAEQRALNGRIGGASNIPTPREVFEYLSQYVIGQDDAKRSLAVAVHNHYVRLEQIKLRADVELSKSNILLIGPTGTGKTHIARALARMLDVPFALADATTLTQAGYVGEDVESVISKLFQNANGDVEKTERGIVYIDEIDKISKMGAGQSVTRDVTGEGVQQALLKLMEGTVANVMPQGGRANPEAAKVKIDTSNILFICGGAFAGLDRIIADRIEDRSIGFAGKVDTTTEGERVGMLMRQRTADDIVQYGLIPEFVGRLPIITTLDDLDEPALVRILTEPKDAIVRQFEHMFSLKGVKLDFKEDGLSAIAKAAMARKTGARALRSIIEEMLLQDMFDLPDIAAEIGSVEVDAAAVAKDGSPIRVPRPSNDDGLLKKAV